MNPSTLHRLSPATLQSLGDAFQGVTHLNLAGDYSYMIGGYYDSLDAELGGHTVLPTTQDALDAYVVPIAMERAKLASISVPDYEIVTDKFPLLPVLAYPINPFSSRFEIVAEGDDLPAKFKALTMTGKYAMICQRLPRDYRVDVVRCVLGRTLVGEYDAFARRAFETFRLPLMKIRVIVSTSDYLLSAIEPLPQDDLTLNEKKLLAPLTQGA